MISNLSRPFNQWDFKRICVLLVFLMMFQSIVYGQAKQITGKVSDESGESLPGVNVVLKGSTVGTTTDFNGNYSISVKSETDELVFSFVGYLDQAISVEGQSVINAVLKEDVLELNEVVAIGYGIQKKSDVTGSVSSIKAESIKDMPTTRIDEAIQGKAAGVMVLQNSGQPGAAPVIRVRGLATINGGTPLVIIDGVAGGSLADLNPADIESIEILKDAASQSIYGAAGGNGVILVSTKKGQSGKMNITFDAYAGIQKPWAVNVEVCDAQQYAELYNIYQGTLGKEPYFPYDEASGMYLNTIDNTPLKSTNWTDEIFRNSLMQNYNLSLSGGGKVSNFFFSFGYTAQDGTIHKTYNNKFNIRLNSDHKITQWLKVGENISFTNNIRSGMFERNEYGSPLATAIQMLPFVPIYTSDGSGNFAFKESGLSSNIKNPMAVIEYDNNINKGNAVFGNVYLHADIIKGLSFETRFGMNYTDNNYQSYTPIHTIGEATDANASQSLTLADYTRNTSTGYGWQWQNFITYNFSVGKSDFSILAGMESGESYYDFLNTSRSISPDEEILETVDADWRSYTDTTGFLKNSGKPTKSSGFAYFGRITFDYNNLLLVQANFRRDYSSKFGPNNRAGNFPSISAGLKFSEFDFIKNLGLIDLGKLRIGYGATGNSDIQPFLYVNSFGELPILGYAFDGINVSPGAALLTAANFDLKWETVITKNLGLDLGLFNNRLSLTFEIFERSNEDMLLRKSVPLTVGYMITDPYQELGDGQLDTRPLVNYGTLQNRGWEVFASYRDDIGDLTFELNGNISQATTVIESIGDPLYAGTGRGLSNVCRTLEGETVSAFYGYEIEGVYRESDFTWYKDKGGKWKWAALDPDGGNAIANAFDINRNPIEIYTKNTSAKPGMFKYKDQLTEDTDGDGIPDATDGKIDANDYVKIGDPNPKFVYGFGGSLQYKGFDMNFFFQGSYGNQIFNMLKVNLYNTNNGGLNLAPELIDAYIPATFDTDNKDILPVELTSASNTETGMTRMDGDLSPSEFYVEDGSYMRLKNIQIGYTLPASVSSKIKANRIRVYIGAKNLFTFTKYSGFDPEVNETTLLERGFDRGTYPQSQMFLVGINAAF
ncbi:MAG: TonB-dependent receptor [Prolixibacteraceae bacterium]|nr:TonB-dependent receptor [Prolixibacteraceae bacterium]